MYIYIHTYVYTRSGRGERSLFLAESVTGESRGSPKIELEMGEGGWSAVVPLPVGVRFTLFELGVGWVCGCVGAIR